MSRGRFVATTVTSCVSMPGAPHGWSRFQTIRSPTSWLDTRLTLLASTSSTTAAVPSTNLQTARSLARLSADIPKGTKFFLYVGSIHPRKNLPRLLRAFDLYRRFGHTDIKLVIVGAKAWGNSDLERTLASMKYRSEAVFTGYLADEELQHLLPAARALVYVSLFEGFGIPIVEAWSAGVPGDHIERELDGRDRSGCRIAGPSSLTYPRSPGRWPRSFRIVS